MILTLNKNGISSFIFENYFGVCSLWGGSVANLGTKKHKDKYFEGIDNLDYPGCFAMTELFHGEFLPIKYFMENWDYIRANIEVVKSSSNDKLTTPIFFFFF